MNVCRASFAAILSLTLVVRAAETPGPQTMALDVAVEKGLVSVEMTSLGGAVGNTLKVNVQSKAPEQLRISLTPGTVFVSTSASVQSLVGSAIKGEFTGPMTYRPQSAIVLGPNQALSILIETYCIDYHKRAPRGGQLFTLGRPDPRAMRILVGPKPAEASIWAFQSALWMDRSAVSSEELRRNFRVNDVDLQAAAALLDQARQAGVASIPANVAADVRVRIEGVFSSDPAVRAEAGKALRTLGEEFAGLRATLEANLPPLPPAPGLTVEINTRESLSPESLQALIPDTGAVLEKTEDLVNEILKRVVPGVDSRLPLPRLPIFGQAKPNLRVLLGLLQNPLPDVRTVAARRLGGVRDPQVIEALLAALNDTDEHVRAAAATSLKQLTTQDFGGDAEAWRNWWQSAKKDFFTTPPSPPDSSAEKKPEPPRKPSPGGSLPPPSP